MKFNKIWKEYATDIIDDTAIVDRRMILTVKGMLAEISSFVNFKVSELVDKAVISKTNIVNYEVMDRNIRGVLSKIETEVSKQYKALSGNAAKEQKGIFFNYRKHFDIALKKSDLKSEIITEADLKVSFGGTVSNDFSRQLRKQLQSGFEPATLIKTVSAEHVKEIQKQLLVGVSKGKGFGWSKDRVLREILSKDATDAIRRKMENNVTRIMRTSYMKAVNLDTTEFVGNNTNIFYGSRRVADGRPCIMCTFRDGKFYPPGIEMHDEHPNGMCVLVPLQYPPEFFLTGKISKLPVDMFGMTLGQKLFTASEAEQIKTFGNKSLHSLWQREMFDVDDIIFTKDGILTQFGTKKTLERLPKIGSITYPKASVSKELNKLVDPKDRSNSRLSLQRNKPVAGKKNGMDLVGDGSDYIDSSISNEKKMRVHTTFDRGISKGNWIAFNERARFLGIYTRMDENNKLYYAIHKGDILEYTVDEDILRFGSVLIEDDDMVESILDPTLKDRQARYRKNNHNKVLARRKLHSAVKSGKIKKLKKCEFCKKASNSLHFHHVNYSHHTRGKWLCRPCEIKADTEKNARRNKRKIKDK